MKTYMVKIPAYEVTIDASDELEAFEKAVKEICYADTKVDALPNSRDSYLMSEV